MHFRSRRNAAQPLHHIINQPLCDQARLYVYLYVCHKIARLASSGSNIPWKSVYGALLSHLDVVNVTVDGLFTPGQVIFLYLCSRLCAPSGSQVPRGAHMCSLISRCVVTPTTMLT